MELPFQPNLCFECEILCMKRCKYIKNPKEFLKVANGEFCEILVDCKNCYACEEFCPYENHPFYRIVELQEKFGVKKISNEMMEALEKRYAPVGEFRAKKVKRGLHICLFPEFKDLNKTKLFEGFEIVRGRHVFCNLLYLHYGRVSTIKERSKKVLENLASLGFEELVLFHDECYSFYNSLLKAYGVNPEFQVKHLYEFFLELIAEGSTKELNLKIAYQRPCSNRLNKTDKLFDEICKALAVERVERKFDRENALCCGAPFILSGDLDFAKELQSKNIEDIASTNVDYVVFLCPMCFATLKERVEEVGLKPMMVHELFEMALF
ncbi:MAG: heterodisulfide reductase-related iron-sulfur binding cluster [Archaeoglobaceae archaeon]